MGWNRQFGKENIPGTTGVMEIRPTTTVKHDGLAGYEGRELPALQYNLKLAGEASALKITCNQGCAMWPAPCTIHL